MRESKSFQLMGANTFSCLAAAQKILTQRHKGAKEEIKSCLSLRLSAFA
jgi:hypothetical protein